MVDLFFWWIGFLVSVAGGVGILAIVVWWMFDKTYSRFGDLKTFLQVYRRMLQERKASQQ